MRVHIATDHAGYELKNYLVQALTEDGHDVVDHGALEYDAQDDYPDTCIPGAQAVAADPGSLGIVIGGSGNGENIAANKVPGIRSILAWNVAIAELGREHNDANVVAVGARQHEPEFALEMVRAFLATPYSQDARHQRRIDKLSAYDASR
ncbi:ribose-5-phosphate isomerase [Raineyella sp. LH-20]|uniref:ribose-5-phosphate isomerase n=1 Tax=Raineyella sp. LH-20 TaxID=3081204 RepID=UPI002952B081|nr:ribose-5-phosphate isomerase [Raineyella sp. LH-20]WOP18535.1 ribose-5-phosphate isomerase [Raineyella sp. LH-20]